MGKTLKQVKGVRHCKKISYWKKHILLYTCDIKYFLYYLIDFTEIIIQTGLISQ